MERYIPVALTQPKPPRIWLLFLEALGLVSGMKKSGTGDSNFVKWKGHFGPTDQNEPTGQSEPPVKEQRWSQIFRSDRTEIVPFDF